MRGRAVLATIGIRRMTTRRVLRLGAVAAVFGACAMFVGHRLGLAHVRWASGQAQPASLVCTDCHHRPRRGPAHHRPHYPDPAGIALAPDGRTLYVALAGADRVAAVDTAKMAVVAEAAFPSGPRRPTPHGIAVAPDGATVYVTLRGVNRLAALRASDLAITAEVGVGVAPNAVVVARGKAFITNGGSDDISVVDLATFRETARLAAGREPYAAAVSPDGSTVLVAGRMANIHAAGDVPRSEVTVVDAERVVVTRRAMLPSVHLAEGIAFLQAGAAGRAPLAIIPAVEVRNLLPILQVERGWVMSTVVALVAPARGLAAMLPLDDVNTAYPDPAGVAVSPDGRHVFVAAGGSDRLLSVDVAALLDAGGVVDVASNGAAVHDGDAATRPDEGLSRRLALATRYVTGTVPAGANPRALLMAPDGLTLYCVERLDDAVAALDPATLAVRARVSLGRGRAPDAVRRGDRVFHSAAHTFQGAFSCRSCHPDAHQDGLQYDFEIDGVGKNIVDNRSLLGLAGTAPFKWNGQNPDIQTQCGIRFAKVLTRADPIQGRRLEDLTAFLLALPPPPPTVRAADGSLTPAQQRGKAIFERATTRKGQPISPADRCTTCHPDPLFTNARTASVNSPDAGGGAKIDAPQLLGVGMTAPYLHDGRAATLEEVWTRNSVDDTHGKVNDLTKMELNDLVEFLKGL